MTNSANRTYTKYNVRINVYKCVLFSHSTTTCLVDILVQMINIVFDLQSYLTFRLSTYFTIMIFLRLLTIDHDVMQVNMHQYFLMVGTKLKLQH